MSFKPNWDIEYMDFAKNISIYPKHNEILCLALGLNGEAGEVADKIKKEARDGKYLTREIIQEMGDVLWYLVRLCDVHHTTLQEIAKINMEKLQSRKDRGKLQGSGDDR